MEELNLDELTLQDAIDAFEEDRYTLSYPVLEKIVATKRDPEAMFYLGLHLVDGLGCEQNVERALEIWKRAGKKGSVDAQYALLEHVQTTSQCCKA